MTPFLLIVLLSVQAKAMLLARERRVDVQVDEDLAASLAERRYLHKSIGTLGLLALKPLQVTSYRDTWHRHLLQQRPRAASCPPRFSLPQATEAPGPSGTSPASRRGFSRG